MSEQIYTTISLIELRTCDGEHKFNCIMNVDEYDHEIVVESASHVNGIGRGTVGDLFCYVKGSELVDSTKDATVTTCLRNVLLARVTISSPPNMPIIWKYTFLKD